LVSTTANQNALPLFSLARNDLGLAGRGSDEQMTPTTLVAILSLLD
jgi:hypothetical protein